MAPHKKHLDAHGQTLLARACAKGEYELARNRLEDRREDLDTADYAGNTPLQIASLNGHESIVKLLIESGCNVDCVNNDRETPLLDAVDNGHLGVVKLLLDAGVNPRKANVNGEEPLDRVSADLENADEIRSAIRAAINKPNASWRKASEEHHGHEHSPQEAYPPDRPSRDRRSHGPESPRFSPAALINSTSRRGASSRSSKTSNSQLYKPLDDKTLRQAACRGDEETVMRILQVKDNVNDPESLVGAARGGHETVMEYLLAFGTNPDPQPIPHLAADASTPMLAAIGQNTTKIVKLLLDQGGFDPLRKFKGETYFEIARRRQGPVWEEEEAMLKSAYDNRKKNKDKSPSRRPPIRDPQIRSASKDDDLRTHKRRVSSPNREGPKVKSSVLKSTSPKEKSKRSNSFSTDDHAAKRGPGRPRKEVPTISISGREDSAPSSNKVLASKLKRQETDHAANSSEGETAATKPRRKLVSGRELKDERERQRRSSMVSNNSAKDGSSPKDKDELPDKSKIEIPSEKYHDRAKAIRRDDSMDGLSASGDGPAKRHRSSVTPPHHSSGDRDDSEAPMKRRKLDVEGKEKRQRSTNSSPEDRHRKSSLRDGTPASTKSSVLRDSDKEARLKAKKLAKANHSSEKLVKIKTEDIDMVDAPPATKHDADPELKARKEEEKERRLKAKAEARKREEELKRQEDEKKRKEAEAEEARKKEEAKKQEEERLRAEEERKRREEERLRQEEERKRQEEERRQKEEEERKRQEDEERRRREEEERKRREEAKRREEERLHREQLEREAAEEAARRKEAEERERRRMELEEQRRLAEEAERRRKHEEQERLRVSKLPYLLRWFDSLPQPKTCQVARKFPNMYGVRYDTIVPNATGTPEVLRELWVLNTHVAFLLGDKDLSLSSYPSWARLKASHIAKDTLFKIENRYYAMSAPELRDAAKEIPGYVDTLDGCRMSKIIQDRKDTWDLFSRMDLFFVKVADFMSVVPGLSHLHDMPIRVQYKELPLDEEMARRLKGPTRWKRDPFWAERNYGAHPGGFVYKNGQVLEELKTGVMARVSRTPFPSRRVPRRGFQAVSPEDPDYDRLCREQGINDDARGNNHLQNGTHHASSMSPHQFSALTPVTPGSTEPMEGPDIALPHSGHGVITASHLPNGVGSHG